MRARGWLLEQLQLQASGLTGHLEELWPDVGPDSAWLGGTGEDWERGPYYLDGLLPLAHLLGDRALIGKARRWVEAILASQREDGFFGPASNNDWWPRMVALKVLIQHAEANGDGRVEPFLRRYFEHQRRELPGRPLSDWGEARGAENALSVLWLHGRSAGPWLPDLARLLLSQTLDWGEYLTNHLIEGPAPTFDHRTHVVNVAMGLKHAAVRHLLGEEGQRQVIHAALANLDRSHGMVNGLFSGDEWLAGLEPQRGVETCAVVEAMHSLEVLARTFGDGALADRLELIAFNALPAAISADMRSHQYHQQVNQVSCTVARREWTFSTDDANTFGLEPHFGCCTANMHQGWPKFTRSLWAATPGGLAALAYAPCTVSTRGGDEEVRLEMVTNYPFEETVVVRVDEAATTPFELRLRIPAWCRAPELHVNGETIDGVPDGDGFVRLERIWKPGDEIRLYLPMAVRALPRPNGALGLALGPLVLAFSPGESWSRLPGSEGFGDWEVRPRHSWSFGLALDPASAGEFCRIERLGPTSPPFPLRNGRPPVDIDGVPL
ncbi:MAG: beta-L-arabinofuranosidase domain-containing protein, partial [Deinococcus sp.]